MSLAPLVHPSIRGVTGKPPELSPWCACPGCISRSQQRHHLWPKSYLRGQPYEWVKLPSGEVVSNSVGLCIVHHNQVTGDVGGHAARVIFELDEFFWIDSTSGNLGPLRHHLRPKKEMEEHEPQGKKHVHLKEGERCSTCGYEKPTKRKPGPKRAAKSYTLMVPDDRELGSDILDSYVEQIAAVLGLTEGSQRLVRYYAIEKALAFTTINLSTFIDDLEGGEEDV